MAFRLPDTSVLKTYDCEIEREKYRKTTQKRFLLPSIHRQTTLIVPQNTLDYLLDFFYENYVNVSAMKTEDILVQSRDLINSLIKAMRRRKYRHTVAASKEPILVGGLRDQTIIGPEHDVDILLPLSFSASFKKRESNPGHINFLLPDPHKGARDVFAEIRAKDRLHLSPLKVYQVVLQMLQDAITRLKITALCHVTLSETDKGSLDLVIISNGFRIHVIPTIATTSRKSYYVAKPYDYDANTESDITWRYHFFSDEKRLLDRVSTADCGIRKRALRIVKCIFARDSRLFPVSSYHLKTALMHLVEFDIDFDPCWQRETLKNCVLDLLTRITEAVERKLLPHYHIGGMNLFHNFPINGKTELAKYMKQLSEEKGLVRFLRRTMSTSKTEVFRATK